MNIIFSILLISSIVMMTILSPESVINTLVNGSYDGIKLSITLLSIYAIWVSILDIMDKIGVTKMLSKLTKPITRKLFKGEDEKTLDLIGANFSSNMLGLGGAATPLGIDATSRMNGENKVASDNSILFLIINATSIQLLPTTIIGMRASHGAENPASIIIPSLISTTIATVVGVILAKILSRVCHD